MSQITTVLGEFKCKLPPLPGINMAHCMVINNANEIMILGGAHDGFLEQKHKYCFVLKNNSRKQHSTFLQPRIYSCAVTMPNGIFVFGGIANPEVGFDRSLIAYNNRITEFLPNNQFHWQKFDDNCPEPGSDAHAIAISDKEILITGGRFSNFTNLFALGQTQFFAISKIMKFNIVNKIWTILGNLNHGRFEHASFLYNGKVIITGGSISEGTETDSTEILTLSTGIVRQGGNLNVGRGGHGMGILRIKGISKLVVFGGYSAQTQTHTTIVEMWNDDTETWHIAEDIKSSECLYKFGYCSKTDAQFSDNDLVITRLTKLKI